MFENNQATGMFPALDANIPKEVARTEFYTQKLMYAVYKKESPGISKLDDLKGKNVGLALGYSYPDVLTKNPDLLIEYAQKPIYTMMKLVRGRVDVFIVTKGTALRLMEELEIQDQIIISQKPVCRLDAYIAFQPTERGRALAELFSKAIREMKQDGVLEKILSKVKK